jgi:hypothetical protein
LSAIPTPHPGDDYNRSHKSTEAKGKESQKTQDCIPTVIHQEALYGGFDEQKNKGQAADSAKPPHDWSDKVNAYSTLVIAIFTILLFFAVIWQTKTTRNLERAWVVAHLDWPEGDRLRITNRDSIQNGIHTESTSVILKLSCKNHGRSLARIDDIMGRIDIAPKAIRGRPDEPSLSTMGQRDTIQADSESFKIMALECEGRNTRELSIFVYVLIKYRDIFGKRRETSLGYVIDHFCNIYRQEALPERNTNK